ncbi:E3 ubiquitin-protein ligase DTX3L-like [Macrotis lagotis]|uniref:E3 ubiquitin-protein ligase DTX3L-like n=1 Tax=Macrotis lagotis TaxID=92651 RepID=UPI003D695FBC
MATDSTAHSPPYRVLIRVSESCPGMQKKLQKYFQNPWKSGGGKCKVKAGPTEGTYWVEFYKKQAKEGVIAKRDHSVPVSDTKHVNVFIETNEDPGENNTLEISQLSPQTQSLPKEFPDKKQPEEGGAASASNSSKQKVFLQVEAQLSFKLSKEQREIITNLCPNIKIEGGHDGPEKVIGDYEDIEKIYHFLRDKVEGNDQKEDIPDSVSPSKTEEIAPNECRSLVLYSKPQIIPEEDSNLITIPPHMYEYFKDIFSQTINRIENEHQVHIRSALVYPTGNVSLDVETSKAWTQEEAQEAFIKAFQAEIQNVNQKEVHFTDDKVVLGMQKTLSDKFQNLHIEAEEKDLILWGNTEDILEAQHFIEASCFSQKQPGQSMVSQNVKNGIEVDTLHWRLLGQEFREIEKTYHTVMELIHKTKTQKTLVIFKPKDKDIDLSAHAYEDFADIFQMLVPQIVKEVVILKPLDQKKKCWLEKTFYENLERKHSHVNFEWNEQELTLTGLPKYLEKAMKYIKRYFSVEVPAQQKQGPGLSLGEN